MAYEIGISSSPADLLDKIRVVALARGWTVNASSPPSASTHWLSLQKGVNYFNLLSDTAVGSLPLLGGYIYGCQATGFDAAATWEFQPGSSRKTHSGESLLGHTRCNKLVGPFTSYRIFSGVDHIHVAIETSPNVFSHIAIGVLTKYGAYIGGGYLSMSSWYEQDSYTNYPNGAHTYLFDWNAGDGGIRYNPTIVRCDVDLNNFFYNSSTSPAVKRVTGLIRNGSNVEIDSIERQNWVAFNRTPNEFNLVTPLLPSVLSVSRGSGLYSPVGEVPDFRVINMTNFNAGDIITLGADEWVVLPAKSNTLVYDVSDSAIPSSGDYGYAYKKVM